MRTIITGIATAAALIAVPAIAEVKPGTAALIASPSQEDGVVKDKRYCVKFTITGSLIHRTECKTRSEWMSEQDFDPLAAEK